MPNHFHLLIYQLLRDGISRLMRRVGTTYAMYFNRKYHRVGSLYQGRFQAKIVRTDEQLLHLSRYIHTNPRELLGKASLSSYPWSSYPEYLNLRKDGLSKPEVVLSHFSAKNTHLSYQSFVEGFAGEDVSIRDLTLGET